jgi:hypothetical protein
MSNRTFVKFTENNEWEGETWVHWLQVEGNEAELTKLWNLLADAQPEDGDEETEEPEFELADFEKETLPEEHVDVLVKHTIGGYMAAHTKVVGRFVCPDELGDGGRVFYKGKITDYFTAEVPGV